MVVKKHYSKLAESLLNRFEVIPFYDILITNHINKINIEIILSLMILAIN